MKKILPALAVTLLLLTGCASDEPRPEPLQLSYRNLGQINLNLKNFNIINRAANVPQRPPYVGHQFQPTLAEAVNRWAMDRVQAVGSEGGFATLIIKDASVTQKPLATDGKLFTREQASKYQGRIEVDIEAKAPDGSYGMATANAVHAVTLPEDATDAEKYAAYTLLLNKLMANLNSSLEKSMRQHLGRFMVGQPVSGSVE